MVKQKTFSGEIVTVTQTKATGDTTFGLHWFLVEGPYQGVLDHLNENRIPEHKVKGFTRNSATSLTVLYHK